MKNLAFGLAGLTSALAPAALAQMSVTTFGTSDAAACYRAAGDNLSTDARDCDKALSGDAMTARDRIATLVNRGIVYNRAGRYDDAIGDFDRAIGINAKTAEAFLNRGNSYFMLRRFDEAIDDYRRSLDLGLGKAHIAWYNTGLAEEARKDSVKAREAYRMALELAPDFAPARKKLGIEGDAE